MDFKVSFYIFIGVFIIDIGLMFLNKYLDKKERDCDG